MPRGEYVVECYSTDTVVRMEIQGSPRRFENKLENLLMQL